jgi:hypothetical protein
MPAHKARCYIPCTKAQAATKRKGWHTLKGSIRCTGKPGRTRSYASGGNPQRRHLYTSSGSPLSMDPARHPVQYRWPHKATATSDTKTAPSSRFATSTPHRVQRNNSGPPVIWLKLRACAGMHTAASRGRLRNCPACVPTLPAPLPLLAPNSDENAADVAPCEAGCPILEILSPSGCPAKHGLPLLAGPVDGPAAVPVLLVTAGVVAESRAPLLLPPPLDDGAGGAGSYNQKPVSGVGTPLAGPM